MLDVAPVSSSHISLLILFDRAPVVAKANQHQNTAPLLLLLHCNMFALDHELVEPDRGMIYFKIKVQWNFEL